MRTKLKGLTIGVILLIWPGGCGTGTGNPETASTLAGGRDTGADLLGPADDYMNSDAPLQSGGIECGSFLNSADAASVEAGRQCIRDAFAACQPARYFFQEQTSDGKWFVSFVAVEVTSTSPLACQLNVHTVSEDPSRFVGDQTKTCSTLTEPIELACGIGS